jgi:hypothetical protein
MTRLDNIASRQRTSRLRDLAFAALVVVAGAVSISTVRLAVHASSQAYVAHR